MVAGSGNDRRQLMLDTSGNYFFLPPYAKFHLFSPFFRDSYASFITNYLHQTNREPKLNSSVLHGRSGVCCLANANTHKKRVLFLPR